MYKARFHPLTIFHLLTRHRVLLGLTSLLVALVVGGCSRVQLAYNTADFAIELYASRYLGLDERQVAAWRPVLAKALETHRKDELPALSTLLAEGANAVRTGLTAEKLSPWLDQLETLYRRHARLFAAAAAPLLAALSEAQIDALEERFLEQAHDDATDNDPASLAKRRAKRAERYVENIEWLTGDLSPAQRELVERITAKLPDTTTSWYSYRDRQRLALIALLRRGAESDQLRTFLTDWLADFSDLPPDLMQARTALRDGLIRLAVELDATFSDQQRQRFERRLMSLSEDFQALQPTRSAKTPGV